MFPFPWILPQQALARNDPGFCMQNREVEPSGLFVPSDEGTDLISRAITIPEGRNPSSGHIIERELTGLAFAERKDQVSISLGTGGGFQVGALAGAILHVVSVTRLAVRGGMAEKSSSVRVVPSGLSWMLKSPGTKP